MVLMNNKPASITSEDLTKSENLIKTMHMSLVPIISLLEEKLRLTYVNIESSSLRIQVNLYLHVHCRRMLESVNGTVICAQNRLVLPTILSARALLETLAVFSNFYNEFIAAMKKAMEDTEDELCNFLDDFTPAEAVTFKHLHKISWLEKYFQKNPLEKKEGWEDYQAERITNHIKNLTAELEKIQPEAEKFNAEKIYAELSEICHPNYAGLLGLYTAEDPGQPFAKVLYAATLIPQTVKPFLYMVDNISNLMNEASARAKKQIENLLVRSRKASCSL